MAQTVENAYHPYQPLVLYWLGWLAGNIERGATSEEFLELAEIALTSAVEAATSQVRLEWMGKNAETIQGQTPIVPPVQAPQDGLRLSVEAPGLSGSPGFGESNPG